MSLIARQTIGEGLPGGINPATPNGAENAIGYLFQWVIAILMIGGGFLVAYYLVYGAITWITSSGEKEKIEKARKMMTNAAIGLVMLMAVVAVWLLLVAGVFGIVKQTSTGFQITLPTLFGN